MAIEAAKPAPIPGTGPRDAVPRDPAYLKVRDLVYRISGIYHSNQKLYLLLSRCGRRMTVCGATSPSEYLDHLTVRGNRDTELRLLLNRRRALHAGHVSARRKTAGGLDFRHCGNRPEYEVAGDIQSRNLRRLRV